VLGRAPGWVDELDRAFELTEFAAPVVSVNNFDDDHYPGCDFEHVVGIHCRLFPPKGKRRADVTYHSEKPEKVCPDTDVFWPLPGMGSGSSALLGVFVALNMGFDPVYVAGVHLDEVTSIEDAEGHKVNHSYRLYRDGWVNVAGELRGRVVSVSPQGTFLRELLGGVNGNE
jgi:hypothetical protein